MKHIPQITHLQLIGGAHTVVQDIKEFTTNGAHIVITTPGRFMDLLTRQGDKINLAGGLKALVLLLKGQFYSSENHFNLDETLVTGSSNFG